MRQKTIFLILAALTAPFHASLARAAGVNDEFVRNYNAVLNGKGNAGIWIDSSQSGFFGWKSSSGNLVVYSLTTAYAATPTNTACPAISTGVGAYYAPPAPSTRVRLSNNSGPSALCKILSVVPVSPAEVAATYLAESFKQLSPGAIQLKFGMQVTRDTYFGPNNGSDNRALLFIVSRSDVPSGVAGYTVSSTNYFPYNVLQGAWPLDEFGGLIPAGSRHLTGDLQAPPSDYLFVTYIR